jgi:hypothetical protein
MISFKDIVAEKENSKAYVLGADSFLLKKPCPFDTDSKVYADWLIGYKDAEYLHGELFAA